MALRSFSDYRVLIVPGLHNSGPGHWQSRWQRLYPQFERVEQDDWEKPDLAAWSARLDRARRWNCKYIDGGALGHINAESGLGDWVYGQAQLQTLFDLAQSSTRHRHAA